jgi:uncharacterized protein YciI
MAYFHLKLIPPRSTFPSDMTEVEREAMGRHAAYWQGKAEERIAIAVGPVFDPAGTYGMAVVEIHDEDAAQALGENDPVVQAGLGFRYAVASIPSLIPRA